MANRRYQNSHITEQDPHVLHRILVPAMEERGLLSVHDASLLREGVDRVRPEIRTEFDNRVGTAYDAAVRAMVDGELDQVGR